MPPIPSDFADNAFKSRDILRRMYGASSTTISAWRHAIGVTPEMLKASNDHFMPKPVPADFMTIQDGASVAELRERYGCSKHVVARWLREIGAPRKSIAPAKPVEKKAVTGGMKLRRLEALPPQRDSRIDSQAADYLRRDCAVYRCTEAGGADQQGEWWRYGRAVYTPDELVQKAARKGWRMAA